MGCGLVSRILNINLRQGYTLLPLRKAVIIQSEQKRCRHSLVVIVFFNMSKQMGHMSSLCRLRGLTAISVLSVIASCGVRCNSYSDNSHVLLRPTCSADAILNGAQSNRSGVLNSARTNAIWKSEETSFSFQPCYSVANM